MWCILSFICKINCSISIFYSAMYVNSPDATKFLNIIQYAYDSKYVRFNANQFKISSFAAFGFANFQFKLLYLIDNYHLSIFYCVQFCVGFNSLFVSYFLRICLQHSVSSAGMLSITAHSMGLQAEMLGKKIHLS